jgi:hypothetical protein
MKPPEVNVNNNHQMDAMSPYMASDLAATLRSRRQERETQNV